MVPYLPLKALPSLVGVAVKQYEFLGFRLIPGVNGSSSTAVYEDDGNSTAYLDGSSFVWTHCNVSRSKNGQQTSVTLLSVPAAGKHAKPYPTFPRSRSYQIRLPNGLPPSRVSLSIGASTAELDVPFVRYGAVVASRRTPRESQWYYAFEEDEGLGTVIDIVHVPTTEPISLVITTNTATTAAAPAMAAGLFGTLLRAVYAHANQDIDRSNPDSNSPGPAYLSQLSSVGVALEKLADPAAPDKGAFARLVQSVPALLANATAELEAKFKKGNGRLNYTLALLQ